MSRVKAIAGFSGTEAGELTFEKGDIFQLLEEDDSGWSLGLLDNKMKGWFPSDRVEEIEESKPPPKPTKEEEQVGKIKEKPEKQQAATSTTAKKKKGTKKKKKKKSAAPAFDPMSSFGSPPPPVPDEEEAAQPPQQSQPKAESQPDGEKKEEGEQEEEEETVVMASSEEDDEDDAAEETLPPYSKAVQQLREEEESSEEGVSDSASVMSPPPQITVTQKSPRSPRRQAVAIPNLMEKLVESQNQEPLTVADPSKSPRVLVGKFEQLISPHVDNARDIRISVMKKSPQSELNADVSPIENAIGSSKEKANVFLNHLILNQEKAGEYHKDALAVYTSILAELTKMLKLLRNRDKRGIPAPTSDADPMNEKNATGLLHIYQNFIITVARDETYGFGIVEAFNIILELAKNLGLPELSASKGDKSSRPSLKSKISDQTPPKNRAHEFLLETLLKVLESREHDQRNPIITMSEADLNDITSFCFDSLYYISTAPARELAGKCLGVLSEWQLDNISIRFTKKFNHCRSEDDFREYATYQLSIKHLRFRLNDERVQSVVQYLGFLTQIEAKIKSSVLRVALSESLQDLIEEMDVQQTVGCLDAESRAQFTNALGLIFQIAQKWLKKPKTKVAAYRLLLCLSSHFDSKLLVNTSKFLLKMVLDLLKDKNHRLEGLTAYSAFVRGLPRDVSSTPGSKDVWEQHVQNVIPAILVKKTKDTTPKEWKTITGIILEMCQLQPSLITNPYLISILTSDFSSESRNVVLQVFGNMFNNTLEEVKSFADKLQPAVTPLISTISSNAQQHTADQLRSVLMCFPHLCVPEKRKEVANSLISLAFSSDPELATTAMRSLQTFLVLDMKNTIRFVLNAAVDYLLLHVVASADVVMTHIQNLTMLMNTFGSSSRSEATRFNELKDRMGALAVSWSIHPETMVRQDACKFVASCRKHLKLSLCCQFSEEDIAACPALFLKSGWLVELGDRLLANMDECASTVVAAWKCLREQWRISDHAVFFIKTLPFILNNGDDTGVGTEVITKLSQVMASADANPDLRSSIFAALDFLDKSCVESFARVATAMRQGPKKSKATLRGGKNKSSLDESPESAMIRAYHILASKVDVSLFNESNAVRTFVRERVDFWKNVPVGDLSSLNSLLRLHLISFLSTCFALENMTIHPLGNNEEEQVARNWAILHLIRQVHGAPSQNPATPRHDEGLREAVTGATAAFGKYAVCDNETLHSEWLPALLSCFDNWGKDSLKVSKRVYEGLGHYLNRHPSQTVSFIHNSMSQTAHAPLYAEALAASFKGNLNFWLSQPEGATTIVYTIFCHFASPTVSNRSLATSLAKALASEDTKLSPGFLVSSTQRLPFQMYVELALEYSEAMSRVAPQLTLGLLRIAATTFGSMTISQQSMLLQLLSPWLLNYVSISSKVAVDAKQLLQFLLAISKSCDREIHREALQRAWQNILVGFTESSLPLAVNTIIAEFKRTGLSECLTSIASLTRSKNGGSSVLTHLSHLLPRYPSIPVSGGNQDLPHVAGDRRQTLMLDAQYADIMSDAQQDEVISKSQSSYAAFHMLSYLALEKGDLLAPYLPVLLQSAMVQYMVENDAKPATIALVTSMLQNMLRSLDLSADVRALATSLLITAEDDLHLLATAQGNSEKLLQFVEVFSNVNENLRDSWASLALDWGIGLENDRKAMLSLDFVEWLVSSVTVDILRRLCTGVFISISRGWRTKTEKLAEVVLALGSREPMPKEQLMIVGSLGLALVSSCVKALALNGIKMLQLAESVLLQVWQNSPSSFEDSFVLRLLFDSETREGGVWLIRQLCSVDFNCRLLCTLSTAIISLTTDAGRVDCANWIGSNSGKDTLIAKHMSALVQEHNFHLKPDLRAEFLTRFGSAFHVICPETDAFQLAIESLLLMIRNGADSWKGAVYSCIRSLLDRHTQAPSPKAFALLSQMVIYDCYNSQLEVRRSAESMVLDLISQYQPQVVSAQVLTLYRVLPPAHVQKGLDALFCGSFAPDVVSGFANTLNTLEKSTVSTGKPLPDISSSAQPYLGPIEIVAPLSPRLTASEEAKASTINVVPLPAGERKGVSPGLKD